MLTREEKKKLKQENRESPNSSLMLLSPDSKEVAKMLYKGFDFPWSYGYLSPSEYFSEYSELFEKKLSLKTLNEISDLGFKIINGQGEEQKYTTLNIVGLEWEYK